MKNNNSLRLLMTVAMLLLFVSTVFAQDRTITGTIVDNEDMPLAGAAVVVPGTQVATVSNHLGVFTLEMPEGIKTIEVSFIGFKTQRIAIHSRNVVNIKMEEDSFVLDEVVAIGYGTTKKGNLSGAIVKVDESLLESRDAINPLTALQGLAAGVEIRTNSGAPGEDISVRVRGAASVNADTEPLYVVDGIPVDDLNGLNSSDIQSIEVLKDASSAAIYGSRGANGVILITTKMPTKETRTRVDFTASYGIQQLERKVDVLSPTEWIAFRTNYNNARYVERYASKGATVDDDYIARVQMIGSANTSYVNDPRWTMPNYGDLRLVDWQDEFFRLAPKQSYQLAVSGGNGQTTYRVSVGYINQDGIAIETSYDKLTMQARLQTSLLNNRVKIGFDLRPSVSNADGGKVDGKDNMGHRVLSMTPIVESEPGLYTSSEPYDKYTWASSGLSPIAYMEQISRATKNVNITSSMFAEVNIMKGLKATVTGSYSYKSTQGENFIPSSVTQRWADAEGYQTTATRTNSQSERYLFQTVLNYDNSFKAHTVSGMAGFSIESSDGTSSSISAKQFPNNALESFDNKDVVITAARALYDTPNRMASLFGRVQYEYDNRYVLLASLRGDGSSRLGRNNFWGIFPAVSGAYRISNEAFWPTNNYVSQLKLRGSWGINGNNRVSGTAAHGLLSSANYSLDGALVNGYAPTSIVNDDLGWERTYSWNFGLDVGLFNNRVSLSFEYYDKTTEDLLYQVSVPATMGFTRAWGNIGSISNKGYELEISTRNIDKKFFKWNTSLNISYNKNKVESLGDSNSTVFLGYSTTNTQVLMVGQPVGAYYMYDAVGVYQFQEDLKKYPIMNGSVLGDVRYRDANDDGVIDDNDRTLVGKPSPDFTYGMTNTFIYRNFELSMLLTAQSGGKIYSVLGRGIDRPGMGASVNVLSHWKNMWISEDEPGDGRTPGITNSNTGSLYDSRWLYSTDFIKIKNITLNYRFRLKKNAVIKNMRAYIAIENLWMWDKYSGGFSPETNNGNLLSAYDYGAYPQARIYTVGTSITF